MQCPGAVLFEYSISLFHSFFIGFLRTWLFDVNLPLIMEIYETRSKNAVKHPWLLSLVLLFLIVFGALLVLQGLALLLTSSFVRDTP